MLLEPLQDMFTKSALLVLDFSKIPKNTPTELDIRQYFAVEKIHACPKTDSALIAQRWSNSSLAILSANTPKIG
jgi:hypothetical protein